MFFKKIKTAGLAHFSYMVGNSEEIAVIDPMRDVQGYLNEARKAGLRIKYILETHRNEDFISGSMELAAKTGAVIYISGHEELGHVYGEKIMDGFRLDMGEITLKAIHTPGHTLGHLSYALYEKGLEDAFMVFTGDCMFMGDFGRTDFYGRENLEKMTGLLYESIFQKLLPLGEHVIMLPAHGPGSACGVSMDDRPFTTLGYEKAKNELLQLNSKEEFIKRFAKMRIKPQYFEIMEVKNVKGADFVGDDIVLNVLQPKDLKRIKDSAILLDTRSKEAYIGGHIPGSIFLNKGNLTAHLGAIYSPDSKIAFIIDGKTGEMDEIYWYCKRIGFDQMAGYLPDSIELWQEDGNEIEKLPSLTAREYKGLEHKDYYILLDVRDAQEKEESDPDKNSVHIPLKTIHESLDKLDSEKVIYVLCSSGNRAATAASYLKVHGYNPWVITGGAEMYKTIS